MEAISQVTPTTHSQALPILAFKDTICEMVNKQFISVIQGDTGCGKSSQVPQMLLADCKARGVLKPLILCTQPRRIAAISLAKRVADEMGEPLGRTVGFMIGADRVVGRDTYIRFVTTGWAFEKLIHGGEFLQEVTHLVLDEVHERSIDADLLHLLLKLVLPSLPANKRPKVVLMSATFNAGIFSTYYCPKDPPQPLYVGAKRYSVTSYFLEQFKTLPQLKNIRLEKIEITEQKRLGVGGPANMLFLEVCRQLHDYHLAREEPCCILVFLSGIAEIDALWEHIEEMEDRDGAMTELSDESLSFEEDQADNVPKPVARKALQRFQLCMLHSSVDKEDQMTIFSDIPVGKTRVILSTNIAESSVTIPNARYVIDAGFHKHMAFDERLGFATSKAAAKQRAGRTGRLFPGTALRFYSEQFYEQMPEYDEPDMLRLPLFNTILRLKVAAQDDAGFVSPLSRPSEALGFAIDPPSHSQISGAYEELFKHGHMVAGVTDNLDDSVVTPLGKFLQKLNVDIRLGSIVVTALVLFPDYIAHAIVMAVSMSLQNVFVHANPRTGGTSLENQESFFQLLSKVEKRRTFFNSDLFSDAMTCLRVFGSIPNTGNNSGWLFDHGLHHTRIHQLQSQSLELAQRLAPLVPAHIAKDLQHLFAKNHRFVIKEDDAKILRFILCYSLSDVLMEGKVSLTKLSGLGFDLDTVQSDKCVFFQGFPHELLEMGGLFETRVLNPLFVSTHKLKYRILVGKTNKARMTSAVAVEFDNAKDAMFAQVVLEGCSKNGKMTFWISKDERVTVPAPVSRNSLKLKVLNHGTSAKIGGASSVNYVMDEGSHFYLPGQTIFVQNSVIVEDVTWLSGKEEWVWRSIALSPNSRVTSPSTVGLGAVESFDHDYNPDVLKKLVELKHLAASATTTQFSPVGRIDLGAEICRFVLELDVRSLTAPVLKSNKAIIQKVQPSLNHKASVLVISKVDGSSDFKMNVVKQLSLKSVEAVAASKVLEVDKSKVQIRLAKTGKFISSDEEFSAVIEKDADAMGILRLIASEKGLLMLGGTKADSGASNRLENEEEEMQEESSAPTQSRIAQAGSLVNDSEGDDWLRGKIASVLKMHADGRMRGSELVSLLKVAVKSPERINLLRLSDVVFASEGKLDISRGVFCLGSDYEDDQQETSFSFDVEAVAAAAGPALDFAEIAKKVTSFDNSSKSPGKSPQYTGVAKRSGSKKSGSKKTPKKMDELTKSMSDARLGDN